MAKKTKPKAPEGRPQPQRSPARQDDLALMIAALKQATDVLTTAGKQLQQFAQSAAAASAPAPGTAPAAVEMINSWDDPFSEAVPTINPPLATPSPIASAINANPLLRTAIVEPQLPSARYSPGTAGFRYWVATEALARGINFWGALLPAGTTWSTANPMRVILVDAAPDLNARYIRNSGLHFYQRLVANIDVRSAESPDVVCHELGHAVLDALRPQLFNVADAETGAFHESFGDVSAILCALQLPSMRQTCITETNGRLNVNSRLSRLAEQLGWAIRQLSPTAVDRDSLRNAANRFFYRRVDLLPPSAPANLLSSEVHSFSRVFTGAFLDALARMFAATGTPNEANLLTVSRELGQLIVDAVRAAPITTGYFSQVAAAMIQADEARFGGRNRPALTGAFLERGILSVDSAVAMANAPVPRAASVPGRAGVAGDLPDLGGERGSPTVYAYEDDVPDDGFLLGYGQTPEVPVKPISIAGALSIDVHAPAEPPRFAVASSMVGSGSDRALNADATLRLFVEGLIQRREIDLGPNWQGGDISPKDSARTTHSLVAEGGKRVLKRSHFDCGFCQRADEASSFSCD